MDRFSNTVRAGMLAIPLALSCATDALAQTTRGRVTAAIEKPEAISPFYYEVRSMLMQEKCFVLSKTPKNTAAWLAAVDEFNQVNERYKTAEFDEKADTEFERMKTRLENERRAAGHSFAEIMDAPFKGGRCGVKQI